MFKNEHGGGHMQQYIGKVVLLIYVDSKRNVSIRNVKILVAGDSRFMAYCYQAKAVRTFNKSHDATRHVEAIIKQHDGQYRREKVEFDHQELEMISQALQQSLMQRLQIKIKMHDLFEQLEIIGIVERVDSQLKRFKVNGDWFELDDIEGVETS